jgi:hypothetical protein
MSMTAKHKVVCHGSVVFMTQNVLPFIFIWISIKLHLILLSSLFDTCLNSGPNKIGKFNHVQDQPTVDFLGRSQNGAFPCDGF